MIKVCSLDFLNKENFETDLKLSDGRVLIRSGEKITPELILKLYFKDIYIEEVAVESKVPSDLVDVSDSVEEKNIESPLSVEQKNVEKFVIPPTPTQEQDEDVDVVQNVAQAPSSRFDDDSDEDAKIQEDKLGAAPKSRYFEEDEAEIEETSAKGPVFKGINLDDTDVEAATKTKKTYQSMVNNQVEEEPVDKDLEFDEDQAKRMASLAVEIGKVLNYRENDLVDLKNAALYCNIGVTKFKESDKKKIDFETYKSVESARIAEDYRLSDRALETIRLHSNDYDSNSFSLNQKIPHYHVIGIVYYFEKLRAHGVSKVEALDKMLQYGGNKFNIFVLHKFIKMMKEKDE